MSEKAEIVVTSHTTEELKPLLNEFLPPEARILATTQLFGGYSGSNYVVDVRLPAPAAAALGTSRTGGPVVQYVLKIMNNYTPETVNDVATLQQYLHAAGYTKGCTAYRTIRSTSTSTSTTPPGRVYDFVSSSPDPHGHFGCLLEFKPGRPVDKVLREEQAGRNRPVAQSVMHAIGIALAELHQVLHFDEDEVNGLHEEVPAVAAVSASLSTSLSAKNSSTRQASEQLNCTAIKLQYLQLASTTSHTGTTTTTSSVVLLRTYLKAGCCDVMQIAQHYFQRKLHDCPYDDVVTSRYVPFFLQRCDYFITHALQVAQQDLPCGIVHGDPFADNILCELPKTTTEATATTPATTTDATTPVDATTPETNTTAGLPSVAFIDFEDVCIGPLLFDIAVCIIGSCFVTTTTTIPGGTKEDTTVGGKEEEEIPAQPQQQEQEEEQVLDLHLLSSFLNGYTSVRALLPVEQDYLYDFLITGLLCNCTWRFVGFNIDNRSIPQCRDAYKELQNRIVHIEHNEMRIKNSITEVCGGGNG